MGSVIMGTPGESDVGGGGVDCQLSRLSTHSTTGCLNIGSGPKFNLIVPVSLRICASEVVVVVVVVHERVSGGDRDTRT